MSEYILLSSGFLIPASKWFTPIESDPTYRTHLLSREGGADHDSNLADLIKSNSIYSSKECNEAFLQYQHKPSFEGYMRMVDIFTEIFAGTDLGKFYDIQTRNPYLSPLGFSMLNDSLSYKFHLNYKQYGLVPSFFRLVKDTSFPDMETRKALAIETKKRTEIFDNKQYNIFNQFVYELTEDRNVFSMFFKYMLTDSNRGNSYA